MPRIARERASARAFAAASAEAISSAAAPSLTPDALPAVTVPSGRTIGFSLASASSVVSARGCSSVSTSDRVAFALPGSSTGDDLARRRRPPAMRASPRAPACAARTHPGRRGETWKSCGDVLAGLRHRIDAVLRLHQRVDEAPADRGVVDLGLRWNAVSALGITNGARLMISTPPAMTRSTSPAGSPAPPSPTASRPEAQSRLTVAPGTVSGKPGQQHAPCARRCGCPRRPGWRSREAPRRPLRPARMALRRQSAGSGSPPGRRRGPGAARRRSGRSACAPRRR